MSDPLWPRGYTVHGILQARRLEWVADLQGIFPTQVSKPGLPHCRQILYHQGSPCTLALRLIFSGLANTFFIYLESWKESKHRYLSFNQFGSPMRPWWLSGKKSTCQCRRCGSLPGLGRSLAEGNGQPTPVFLPGKFSGQKNLVGHGIGELDTTQWLNNPF